MPTPNYFVRFPLILPLAIVSIFQFDRKQWYFTVVLIYISLSTEVLITHLYFFVCVNDLFMTSTCFTFGSIPISHSDLYQVTGVFPTLGLMWRISFS